MDHPQRWYPAGTTYLIIDRTAEGLPFGACLYINLMLFGILARAVFRFPSVIICGWIFLSNHSHGRVVLKGSPNEFKNFTNYVAGEIAKLVVRWRGSRDQNVWALRYHAAPILTWDSLDRLYSRRKEARRRRNSLSLLRKACECRSRSSAKTKSKTLIACSA